MKIKKFIGYVFLTVTLLVGRHVTSTCAMDIPDEKEIPAERRICRANHTVQRFRSIVYGSRSGGNSLLRRGALQAYTDIKHLFDIVSQVMEINSSYGNLELVKNWLTAVESEFLQCDVFRCFSYFCTDSSLAMQVDRDYQLYFLKQWDERYALLVMQIIDCTPQIFSPLTLHYESLKNCVDGMVSYYVNSK